MGVGSDGTVHIAWVDLTDYGGSGTDVDVFYKRFEPGVGWTVTEVVSTESTDNSYLTSLGVGSDGTVHIAWSDLTDYGGSGTDVDVFYKRYEILPVHVDIKPGSWPNPLKLKSEGVLPVAVCGTEDFDVTTIDPETIRLTLEGIGVGVAPLRWSYDDVATPYTGEPCSGHDLEADGYLDLTLKFKTQEVRATLGLDAFNDRDVVILILTGNLKEAHGGTPIQGQDCMVILDP